jgi:transposase
VSSDPRDERISELEKENAELRRQMQELARRLKELEEKQRRDKKQAARFSRRKHVKERRKPGPAAGHPGAYQAVPDHVDEEVYAPLSECPDCHGEVAEVEVVEQFVVDLPEVKPHVTRVVTERGYCACCKRSVRSNHPRQVSQAVGAAKVSLGPRALGLAAELKHRLGVPYRKVADLFGTYFGLVVTHGALVQATLRLAKLGQGTYEALIARVRQSPVVHTDDTGWRVDLRSAWLWVFATSEVTVYGVRFSRGSDVVSEFLTDLFAGWLVSDGLPALNTLTYWRQQCLGHFLHRASELEEDLTGRAVCFPRDVKALLQEAVEVSRKKDQLAPATLQRHADRLETRLDELLARRLSHPENRRLSQHLLNHYDELFPCITVPRVPSTNNLAEQELRPAVVVRKIGGCNRSEAHASAHAIIASVAQTAHRRDATLTDFVTRWLQPTAGPLLRSLQDALFANLRLFAGTPTPAFR